MKKVLLINAHHKYDGLANGQLNDTLTHVIADEVRRLNGELAVTNIEQFYDIDDEVEKHMWADIIITQSPVYWCALPWQYKKYIEEVFNAGLTAQKFVVNDGRTTQDPSRQYGSGGLMQGKQFMLSLTFANVLITSCTLFTFLKLETWHRINSSSRAYSLLLILKILSSTQMKFGITSIPFFILKYS